MPTVNAASLREEFEACRAKFQQLCQQGKISPESKVLFDSLLTLMRLLMTVFLEKTTRKGSKNSSLPSSRTAPDETASGKSGTRGKGPDPKVHDNAHTRKVTKTTVSTVTECSGCGRDIARVECDGHEKRTRMDIVFEIRTEHVEAEIKTCPDCHTETRGAFPDNLPGPRQYGHGIIAFAVHLLTAQMVPLRRVAQTLKAFLEHSISEATLLAWIWRLHEALADWEAQATRHLLASPILHADETSIRIDKKNHWLHSYSAGDLTLVFVHPNRGCAAMDELNIIPRYRGILIHDRWASYLSYDKCDHALCGAHLLRDLQFIIDSNNHAWARSMKKLLKEAAHTVARSKHKKLTERDQKRVRKRYRTILTKAKRELPQPPPRTSGKRGRIAKSDAENLHEAFTRYETEILRFTQNPDVAFTNNRSERDIRMAKVKQKVSGCFRSPKYAAAHCRISSYLKSMAYKGYNPLTAIQIALCGNAEETIGNLPIVPAKGA